MQATITTTDTPVASTNGHQPLHTLSILVSNQPGVLARIAQIFARRGFNIESLVVSPARDGRYSRMTVGARGELTMLGQIICQVNKLIDVLHCYDHTLDNVVVKELALIKVKTDTESRGEVLQIAEHFATKTVDLTENALVLMGTGDSSKIDALISMVEKFGIIELVRTGKVVMTRGEAAT